MLLAGLGHVALAADAPAYPDLLQDALTKAPVLVEQRATVNAASADAAQARAWLNPRLDALSENLGAPASGGVSQRQNTYTLTQPLEIGGKRSARIEAGERNLAAAEARARQVRVAFAARLALAYAEVEAAQSRQTVAGEEVARAEDDLKAATALVRAGREADLRQAQARASVAAARAALQAAAADVTQGLQQLSALTGTPDAYTGLGGSVFSLGDADAPDAVLAADNPAVQTARAERDALEADVKVEQRRWIPEIGVSAGLRRYGWTSTSGYVVGVSATLPLLDRNRNGITAAQQRQEAAQARLNAAEREAMASRRSAEAQLVAAGQRLTAAGEGESAAAEAYRLGRIGYEAGRTPLIELLAIRRTLADARLLTIDARLARIRALAALAQADGRLAFGE